MPKQQNIEYKPGWHDDYLKWVCGFALPRWKLSSERFRIEFGMNSETKWHPKLGGWYWEIIQEK